MIFLNLIFALSTLKLVLSAQLLWSDEFDQEGLPRPDYWSFDIGNGENGWGLGQKQYYTNENAQVKNGFLTIRIIKENKSGFNYTSSKLASKLFFKHSVIEIRAKLPRGKGLWSAFWLKGDGPWPDTGDLDILEHVGYQSGRVHASIINKVYNNMIGSKLTGNTLVDDLYNNFHVYKMDWNSKRVKFYVDDKEYFSYYNDNNSNYATWPYDGRFGLIINAAVGGDWFGYIMDVDNSIFPQDLVIDYIRQYAPNN